MMNSEQADLIIRKMDIIIRFLAFNNTKELKTQSEKIIALSSCGLTPSEIVTFLNTTANTVSVTLSKAKKKGSSEQENKTSD